MTKKKIAIIVVVAVLAAILIAIFCLASGVNLQGYMNKRWNPVCKPVLMNVHFDEKTTIPFDTEFTGLDKSYVTKYPSTWEVSSIDFDNFTIPGSVSGLSIAVPAFMMNGVNLPKYPDLQKTNVNIGGYKAVWTQQWVREYCIESGKIIFTEGPVGWHIEYLGSNEYLPLIKSVIYNIRFLEQ